LVKRVLNPLKRQYGMRYMDLLKPDVQGAVLAALGVHPAAVKVVLRSSSIRILWDLVRNAQATEAFLAGEEPDPAEVELSTGLRTAGLDAAEADALQSLLDDRAGLSFDGDGNVLRRLQRKLTRAGLRLYAAAQHALAGQAGADFFNLAPEADEVIEARRLGEKFAAGAVVSGHTHAARWFVDNEVVYANTGTWIWLMRLPAPTASDTEWDSFLVELRANPGLQPAGQKIARLEQRFHYVVLDGKPDASATLALWGIDEDGVPRELRRAPVPKVA
jgi:hypothetical protein